MRISVVGSRNWQKIRQVRSRRLPGSDRSGTGAAFYRQEKLNVEALSTVAPVAVLAIRKH